MGKWPSISLTGHARIVQVHLEGLSYRQIQKKMQHSLKAVQIAIYNYKDTGSFKDKERCGRPKITTPKQERIVHRLSSSNRRFTAVDIKKHIESHYDAKLSVSTVKNILKCYGLNGRVARKKPFISLKNRLKHL